MVKEFVIVAYQKTKSEIDLGVGEVINVTYSRKRKYESVVFHWYEIQKDELKQLYEFKDGRCTSKAVAARGSLTNNLLSEDMIQQVFQNEFTRERWNNAEILEHLKQFLTLEQIRKCEFEYLDSMESKEEVSKQEKEEEVSKKEDVVNEKKIPECCVCMEGNETIIQCKDCKTIVCTACFIQTMQTRMDSNDDADKVISCVQPNCKQIQPNVWCLIDPLKQEKYHHRLMENKLFLSGMIRCANKVQKCVGMFFKETNVFTICPYCREMHCNKCDNLMHEGYCIIEKKEVSEEMLKLGVKMCPHCFVHYHRQDGCNAIRCLQCKFIFCHLCLAKANKDEHELHALFHDKTVYPDHKCFLFTTF